MQFSRASEKQTDSEAIDCSTDRCDGPKIRRYMKTVIWIILALGLAARAAAGPLRYESRSFGAGNVNLQPLFGWWTFAAETTNPPLDITEIDPNKLTAVSNLWAHLPARPLPDWFRIMGNEGGITEVGGMWQVAATIEPAPMMLKHQIILLRNPPVKEIQDFKLARATYGAVQDAKANQAAALQAAVNAAQTNTVSFPGTVTTRQGVVVAQSGAAAAEQNLLTAVAISSNAQAADLNQLAAAQNYLSLFPNTNVYYLDHFALRTGKEVNGVEVYDLGTAAGLNY